DDQALDGFARNHRRTGLPAFEYRGFRAQIQPRFLPAKPVAGSAPQIQNGDDVVLSHRLGRLGRFGRLRFGLRATLNPASNRCQVGIAEPYLSTGWHSAVMDHLKQPALVRFARNDHGSGFAALSHAFKRTQVEIFDFQRGAVTPQAGVGFENRQHLSLENRRVAGRSLKGPGEISSRAQQEGDASTLPAPCVVWDRHRTAVYRISMSQPKKMCQTGDWSFNTEIKS